MSDQATETKKKGPQTRKAVLTKHKQELDRAIAALRRGAASQLKQEIKDLQDSQYARLMSDGEKMNAEELFHDIDETIATKTVELTRTHPQRIEDKINALRNDALRSAQDALNNLELALEKARKAKVELEMKSDRVSVGDSV